MTAGRGGEREEEGRAVRADCRNAVRLSAPPDRYAGWLLLYIRTGTPRGSLYPPFLPSKPVSGGTAVAVRRDVAENDG